MKLLILKAGAVLILLTTLQGCIMVDEDSRRHAPRGTTIGEELEDLAAAYENGLLSDREYERIRQRLLDR